MPSVPISSLMSPPEPELLSSFESPIKPQRPITAPRETDQKELAMDKFRGQESTHNPLSPPESPWVRNQKAEGRPDIYNDHVDNESLADPLLFPSDAPSPHYEGSLFPKVEEDDEVINHTIRQHMHFMKGKSRNDERHKRYEPPTLEEYRLTYACVSTIARQEGPAPSIRQARDEIRRYYPLSRRIGAPPRVRSPLKPISPRKVEKSANVPRPVAQIKVPSTPRSKVSKPKDPSTPRAARSSTPGGRAVAIKRPQDDNFAALPDYSPPISTLPDNGKVLLSQFDTSSMDISGFENYDLLHDAEKHIASGLRLKPSLYLACKRRIFMRCLEAYRIGKAFKKTDAQQACQIDVNKASKLWLAFDRAGWFDHSYFEKWLD